MQLLNVLLQCLYTIGAAGLALYGFNALWLTWQSRRYRHFSSSDIGLGNGQCASKLRTDDRFPHVTIQLPIYNERHVAERLIDACAQLHYPADRLQIQVLDDSDDDTSQIVRECVHKWQWRGCNIQAVQRTNRYGFKAGALAHAFPLATGDFIAVFDADFVPPADFLIRTLSHFFTSEEVGFIQTRWGHLNLDYSPLTHSQGLALDGHFLVEQAGRQAAGYAFGFNGSAGIWRRACIADAAVGGWETDTLCEDLDLSYRAQLAGWRPLFLAYIEAPAEIPPQLSAFKRQQARWAQGSIQTLRKLGRRIGRSDWSWPKKVHGIIHLGSYLLHPLLLLLLLVSLPLSLLQIDPAWPLSYLSAASIGPPLLYAVAQRRLYPTDWARRWSYVGVLTLLGFGLCLSNTLAVVQAWRGQTGQFKRTPKFHVRSSSDRWQQSGYRLPVGPVFCGELVLFLYALFAALASVVHDKWWSALFAGLYVGGFALMIGVELWQAWQTNAQAALPSNPVAERASITSPPKELSERDHIRV